MGAAGPRGKFPSIYRDPLPLPDASLGQEIKENLPNRTQIVNKSRLVAVCSRGTTWCNSAKDDE